MKRTLFHFTCREYLSSILLVAYAFFLSRSGAMLALKRQDYAALGERKVATALNCSVRALRMSVQRLVAAGIIERQDTRGNTRTRILLTVRDGKILQKPPAFPQKPIPQPHNESVEGKDYFE